MGYLGNNNVTQNFTPAVDYFNGNGSTTSFTLSRTVGSAFDVQAFIENVPQNPSSAFTVAGNVITFTSAPPSGTNNIYVRYTSPVTQQVKPAPGTVSPTEINSAYSLWNLSGSDINYTAGNVGIGTSSIGTFYGKTVEISNSADCALKFTNAQTGYATSDGVYVGLLNSGNSDFYLNNRESGAMILQTSNTERMRIDSSGNVGIGTTSPQQRLSIKPASNIPQLYLMQDNVANDGWKMFADSSTGDLTFRRTTVGVDTEYARITFTGNFFVGATTSALNNTKFLSLVDVSNSSAITARNTNTSNGNDIFLVRANRNTTNGSFQAITYYNDGASTYRFIVYDSGNVVNTNGSYGTYSDIKLKENIVDASPKLEKLNQVRIINYNLKGEKLKQIGVVAQELEQIFPSMVEEIVDKDAEGNDLGTTTKAVKYSVFVPMLIKAMQEQQAIIENLKARIEVLEAK